MTREEFNYETYSKLVKTIWGEEFERLQEYVYSIKVEDDVRGEKHWVQTPDQDIPDYEEMYKVIALYSSQVEPRRNYLGDLLNDELDNASAEDIESELKQIWYNKVS